MSNSPTTILNHLTRKYCFNFPFYLLRETVLVGSFPSRVNGRNQFVIEKNVVETANNQKNEKVRKGDTITSKKINVVQWSEIWSKKISRKPKKRILERKNPSNQMKRIGIAFRLVYQLYSFMRAWSEASGKIWKYSLHTIFLNPDLDFTRFHDTNKDFCMFDDDQNPNRIYVREIPKCFLSKLINMIRISNM